MTLLTDQPYHRPAVSLTRFICLLLILSCGLGTTAGVVTTYVKLWISGPAAIWRTIDGFPAKIYEPILRDVENTLGNGTKAKVVFQRPHTASITDDVLPHALNADGIGLDTEFSVTNTSCTENEVRYLFYDTISKYLSTGFPEFNASLRVFPFMPDQVHTIIINATIAINQPTYLWEEYLKKQEPLIPERTVYHTTNEVLKELPIDLQSLLDPTQNFYLIMPTQLWTNTSGVYINYTAYYTPYVKPNSITPEQVYEKLVNLPLPRFSEKIKTIVENDPYLNIFKKQLQLPVTLCPYSHVIPPTPIPTPVPPRPPAPIFYVTTVRVPFIIRFSGYQDKWEETMRMKGKQFSNDIAVSAKNVLERLLYDTEVLIKRLQPVKNNAKQIEGLLVYGEATQHRKTGGKHPWDQKDIISVLAQGNYSAAISSYAGELASVELMAVSLDADFGPHLTSNGIVLVSICICLAATIAILVICFTCLQLFMKKKKKNYGKSYEKPYLSNTKPMMDYPQRRTNSPFHSPNSPSHSPFIKFSPYNIHDNRMHLETLDEQRIPVMVVSPMKTTDNTTSEMNSSIACPVRVLPCPQETSNAGCESAFGVGDKV